MEIDSSDILEAENHGYLQSLLWGLVNAEQMKANAIATLENPNASEEARRNALNFAEDYKTYTRFKNSLPQGHGEERAVCIDQNGRRVDLRIR